MGIVLHLGELLNKKPGYIHITGTVCLNFDFFFAYEKNSDKENVLFKRCPQVHC